MEVERRNALPAWRPPRLGFQLSRTNARERTVDALLQASDTAASRRGWAALVEASAAIGGGEQSKRHPAKAVVGAKQRA